MTKPKSVKLVNETRDANDRHQAALDRRAREARGVDRSFDFRGIKNSAPGATVDISGATVDISGSSIAEAILADRHAQGRSDGHVTMGAAWAKGAAWANLKNCGPKRAFSIDDASARIDDIGKMLAEHAGILAFCACALDGGPNEIGLVERSSEVKGGMLSIIDARLDHLHALAGNVRTFAERIKRAIG